MNVIFLCKDDFITLENKPKLRACCENLCPSPRGNYHLGFGDKQLKPSLMSTGFL